MIRADGSCKNIRYRRNEQGPRGDTRKTNNDGETSMTILILLQRIGQRFTDLVVGIEEARLLEHRFKALSKLTDAQLAERGLKREQIPQAVWDYTIHA